ncbi:MAG: hypothetical protein ACREQA_18985 [Candidatus Binatia bacterium]
MQSSEIPVRPELCRRGTGFFSRIEIEIEKEFRSQIQQPVEKHLDTWFDKLTTGFDKPVLSEVEGLRVTG